MLEYFRPTHLPLFDSFSQVHSTVRCEGQALKQSSAPTLTPTPWTPLVRSARHSRHHLSPLRQSQLPIIARCQCRPLISSAHSEVAVYLPSSFTCFSVSCCSTAHAMEALSSCLHHRVCCSQGESTAWLTHHSFNSLNFHGCIYFLSTQQLQ